MSGEKVVKVLDCNAADLHSDSHVWEFGSGEHFVCFGTPGAETPYPDSDSWIGHPANLPATAKPSCLAGGCEVGDRVDGCCTPTPVPSEVAETTAGEREVGALQRVIVSHLRADKPDDYDEAAWSAAGAVLASDWLAALLDRVRREEGAKVLREAAEAIDSGAVDHEDLRLAGADEIAYHGWSEGSCIDALDSGSVWRDWLIARAASVGRGEGL